jgi:hypothetical protein
MFRVNLNKFCFGCVGSEVAKMRLFASPCLPAIICIPGSWPERLVKKVLLKLLK